MIALSVSPAKRGYKQDAIAMLKADHEHVRLLFADFEKLTSTASAEAKTYIVKQLCAELKVHAALEEQIFYPALRNAIHDNSLMDEALAHHAGVKELIAELEDLNPRHDLYAAKVRVLREQVQHHVKEVEAQMFPKAIEANVDTEALGATMLRLKDGFMAERRDLLAR